MDRTAFLKALSARLYPILRAEGFRGSGTTLRRINEPIVHVFNVQGSSGGARCYLNLGAHLLFLPIAGDREPDAAKLKEYECVFRDRIAPPAGFGWSYGDNEDEMNATVALICGYWPIHGHQFFARYSRYPADFVSLVTDTDPSTTQPIELLTLARIAAHLGDRSRSVSLALEALNRCPERATGLRAELERLAAT